MKRRIVFMLAFALLCTVLAGCDEGLRIVKISVKEYPKKLVYYAGIDTELDLSGGVINLHMKQGGTSDEDMLKATNPDYLAKDPDHADPDLIISDIDFNMPGVYTVTIHRYDDVKTSFAVQVIDKQWMEWHTQ